MRHRKTNPINQPAAKPISKPRALRVKTPPATPSTPHAAKGHGTRPETPSRQGIPPIREPLMKRRGQKQPPPQPEKAGPSKRLSPSPRIEPSADRRRAQLRDRFFTAAPEMFCVMDGDGRLNHLNPAWKVVLGYRAADLLGKPLIHFVVPDDRRATLTWLRKLRKGAHSMGFEHRFLDQGGSPRWLEWYATWSPEESIYFATIRDVTERRAALSTLVKRSTRSDRNHQHLLMELGPKLRQEMATLVEATEALMEDARGGPLDLQLSHLRRRGRHLNQMLQDLVDLSTINAGRLSIELEMVDLQQLVQEVAVEVAKMGPDTVVLDYELPERLLRLRADKSRLKQALVHLVKNAMAATRSGSVILRVITDKKTGRPERIDVVDNGPGLPADRLVELLAPKAYQKKGQDRRGLGFSLCQALLPLMNFRLDGVSVQGRGATFSILLHARAQRPTHMPPTYFGNGEAPISYAPPPVQSEPVTPLRLCLLGPVDDRVLDTQERLVDFGYEVSVVSSSADLQRLGGIRPDLILLDLLEHQASGWSILPRLRQKGPLMDLPIMALAPKDSRTVNFIGQIDFMEAATDRDEMREILGRLALPDNPMVLVVGRQRALRQVLHGHLEEMGIVCKSANGVPEAQAIWSAGRAPDMILADILTLGDDAIHLLSALRGQANTRHIPLTLICRDHQSPRLKGVLTQGAQSFKWERAHKENLHKSMRVAAGMR